MNRFVLLVVGFCVALSSSSLLAQAPKRVFVAFPGSIGAGEDQDAVAAGMYRFLSDDGQLVVVEGAKFWDGGGYVYGTAPVGAKVAVVTFDPVTGAVGGVGSAKIWIPGAIAPVSTFKLTAGQTWFSMSATREGLAKVKPPVANKDLLERMKALEESDKELKKDIEEFLKKLPANPANPAPAPAAPAAPVADPI
jgi:hypothetical protein